MTAIPGLIQTFVAGVGVAPSDPAFVEVLTTLASPWEASVSGAGSESREDWEFRDRGAEIAITGGVVEAIFRFTRKRRVGRQAWPEFEDRVFDAFGNHARRADVISALGELLREGPGANGWLLFVASPGRFLHLEFADDGTLSMVTATSYDPNAAEWA